MSDQPASPRRRVSRRDFAARTRSTPRQRRGGGGDVAKSTNWYIKIHDTQLDRLLEPGAIRLHAVSDPATGRACGTTAGPSYCRLTRCYRGPGLSRGSCSGCWTNWSSCGLILIGREAAKTTVVRVPGL